MAVIKVKPYERGEIMGIFENVNKVDIGRALRYNRKLLRLRQSDLSEHSGVQPYVISRIERGEENFKIDTISKLFGAMSMTLKEAVDKYHRNS